ncbi:MAG: hypothetical protein RL199_796 [Pseudomonadota bacterium]|jgi:hypothetical protein
MKKVLAVLLGSVASGSVAMAEAGAEPAVGVSFHERHGWFAETQVGGFLNVESRSEAGYSGGGLGNAALWNAISFGRELDAVRGLAPFATIATGFAGDHVVDGRPIGLAQSTMGLFVEGGLRYRFAELVPRLTPTISVVAGVQRMSDVLRVKTSEDDKQNLTDDEVKARIADGWLPVKGKATDSDNKATTWAKVESPTASVQVGLGGGFEYATRLDGLTVGAEVLVRQALSPFMTSIALYPRLKYVF